MAPETSHGRVYLLIIFALIYFTAQAAFGAVEEKEPNFELITKAKMTELTKEFNDSASSKIEQSKLEKEWSCDMYGARSRYQAERGIRLYAFKTLKDSSELSNNGAHIFKTYKVSDEKNELKGEKSSLKETIRWTKKGQLISKLETRDNTLVAFSSCKAL